MHSSGLYMCLCTCARTMACSQSHLHLHFACRHVRSHVCIHVHGLGHGMCVVVCADMRVDMHMYMSFQSYGRWPGSLEARACEWRCGWHVHGLCIEAMCTEAPLAGCFFFGLGGASDPKQVRGAYVLRIQLLCGGEPRTEVSRNRITHDDAGHGRRLRREVTGTGAASPAPRTRRHRVMRPNEHVQEARNHRTWQARSNSQLFITLPMHFARQR